jgi:hypothetical protein
MRTVTLPSSIGILLALALQAAPAHAANARSWVSANGSDLNPCTRASPCQTFQRAHDQTNAGGIINCLNEGSFGVLVIDRSITIDCTGVSAAITALLGSTAVTIDTPGVVVTLRGLMIDGADAGDVGISFRRGSVLQVHRCRITGFRGGSSGAGIKFSPPAGFTGKLYVADSVINNNGLPEADSGGIIVQPMGSGAGARVVINRVHLHNNVHGMLANGSTSTGVISAQVRDSVSAANVRNGISSYTDDFNATTSVSVDSTSSVFNGTFGVLAQSSSAFVLLAAAMVSSNTTGKAVLTGGTLLSYGNNHLAGNTLPGPPPTGFLTPD